MTPLPRGEALSSFEHKTTLRLSLRESCRAYSVTERAKTAGGVPDLVSMTLSVMIDHLSHVERLVITITKKK
ncbi:MAG: hypothetical protein E7665_08390 [Ruminococcaceae bacterium]|nr:hypothetical protein [Oscillospiraceae bacterium]